MTTFVITTTKPSQSRKTMMDSMTVSMPMRGVTPVFTLSFLRVMIARLAFNRD